MLLFLLSCDSEWTSMTLTFLCVAKSRDGVPLISSNPMFGCTFGMCTVDVFPDANTESKLNVDIRQECFSSAVLISEREHSSISTSINCCNSLTQTHLTHSYIYILSKDPPRQCFQTVRHILARCSHFIDERKMYLTENMW